MLEQLIPPSRMTKLTDSVGELGLTYINIFNKVNMILKADMPLMITHIKAARLLYIANDIRVTDNKFASYTIGNLSVLVVCDDLGAEKSNYIYDVAQVGDVNTLFIFKNALINEYIPLADRFINLYYLYTLLVSMYIKPNLSLDRGSIYNTIARYAPYVLTVKTIMGFGYNISINDIDYYNLPDGDSKFITEETLVIIKELSEEDLLGYGALCEYAR